VVGGIRGLLELESRCGTRGRCWTFTAADVIRQQPATREDADRKPDRIVNDTEAGLGGGLDQAKEARRGKTRYDKAGSRQPR